MCEKAEFSLHSATLPNAPKIQVFILIQKELGFRDFLCDRAVSFALEDKNCDPSPMLLVVAFFYAIVPLDETKIYLVILPTNPFREFESDSSNHWYSGISNCESILPKYLFIGYFVSVNLSIAAGISEHL